MEDEAHRASKHIRAWAVPVKEGEGRKATAEIVAKAAESGAQVLVLRADMVFGLDHIRAAYCHARNAMGNGRGASDSISMETLLYASGERQLGAAIKKMSADDSVREIVVASIGGEALEPMPGWTTLPESDPRATEERLRRYGITDVELSTVGPGRGADLVLEKVAAVDVLKK